MTEVRLDKWLWAARFFKTRRLAQEAINGGKIHIDGQRPKTSKKVTIGLNIAIRQGYDEKTVEVLDLSEHRRGAPEAKLLYQESEESIQRREVAQAMRKLTKPAAPNPGRPNKKERRQIIRFKNIHQDDQE